MRKKFYQYIIIFSAYFLFFSVSLSGQLLHPNNLDFEDGTPGGMPRSWILPTYAESRSYNASITEYNAKSGKYCLELNRFAEYKDSLYGSVMQSIDAKPYRGKTIKFGAWVRAEIHGPKGSAHLWLIEYVKDDNIAFYDMMEDRPIVMNSWEYYEIIADIDRDAEYINFGLMLKGNGKAWIDGAVFEITELNEEDFTPPKELTDREVQNLHALAKIYGLTKFYYPSSESYNLDYDKLLLSSIEIVESAQTDKELIDALNKIFLPYFPGLKIYSANSSDEKIKNDSKPLEAVENAAVSKLHRGTPTMQESQLTSSKSVNVFHSLRSSEGAVIQVLRAEDLKNKKIAFSIDAKSDLIYPGGRAEIRIGAENEKTTREYLLENLTVKEITSDKWKKYELEMDVPEDASALRIGLVLIGEGNVHFDNAELMVDGKKFELNNSDFEAGSTGELTRGWRLVPAGADAGYSAVITNDDKTKGEKSLKIESDFINRIPLPKPGEYYQGVLTGNLHFSFPYCLYIDEEGMTLPNSIAESKIEFNESFMPGGKDRLSRISVFIQAWNNFKHFSMFRNDPLYWDKSFSDLIKKASIDKNDRDFIKTLELLTALLDDSNARVWLGGENLYHGLPFLLKWVDGALIVTKLHRSFDKLRIGDIITEIEGMPAYEYLMESMKHISSANKERAVLTAVAKLRAGIENSSVSMKVVSRDGYTQDLKIKRSIFLNELTEDRLPFAAELRPGMFYIDLISIDDKTFFDLIDTLKRAEAIIFDMRGLTKVSEHFLSFFIRQPINSINWQIPVYTKPIFAPVLYSSVKTIIKARGTLADIELVFLQDETSIGYSEAILSLVEEYGIGEIIGSNTAGTAGEISAFRLGPNYGFAWTSIKAINSKGVDIYGRGIEPTVSKEELEQSENSLLRTAYEIIR